MTDRHARPGVDVGRRRTAYLPHGTVPPLLAPAEPRAGGGYGLYRFVVDVREPAVLGAVGGVLRLPAVFVGHNLRAELICLWRLGLEEPRDVWDTMACEAALHLGMHHKKYGAKAAKTVAEEATAREDAEEQRERALSLLATCGRYGVVHPFGGDKDRLQQSFVDHPDCWNKDGHADSLDRWAADPCYTLRPARVGRGRHAVAEQTPSDDSFTCGGAGRLAAPPGRD